MPIPMQRIGIFLLGLMVLNSCTSKMSLFARQSQSDDKKIIQSFRAERFKSLDPPRQFDNSGSDLIINIYDTLLEYSLLKRPYELTPLLLEKMPEKQKDGLSYLFTLKQQVYFHDDAAFPQGVGQELTSDDVLFTIKRFADANVNKLSYNLLQGLIVGLDEFRAVTTSNPNSDYDALPVSGLKKVDKYRFMITFTTDSPVVFHVFTFSGLAVLSRSIVQHYGANFETHPVGTGAFFVKNFAPDGDFVLAKHARYHQKFPKVELSRGDDPEMIEASEASMPFVDEVHLPLISESKEVAAKFLKNELDLIQLTEELFRDMAYRDDDGHFYLKRKYADQYRLYYETTPSINLIKFNMDDPLLGRNKALRKALAYAADNANAIDLLNNGRGIVLDSIIPPPITGHAGMVSSAPWPRQDLWKASELLKEAGYPRGKGLPEIMIEFNSSSRESHRMFEFMRSEYGKIGVKLKANFQPFSEFLEKVENGNFQLANGGWVADYPDAENFYALLYSKNKAPGPNEGNYGNAAFDALYEKIRFMPNSPERFKLFAEMNAIILEDCPVILQDAPVMVGTYQKSIRNFKMNGLTGTSYKYLDVRRD